VRFYGSKILTIDHERYTINEANGEQARGEGEDAK
jgi:hypothetical protein